MHSLQRTRVILIERIIVRILLTAFLIIAFCPIANATDNRKFDFLLYFFDMNEAAFAYHRHCLYPSVEINQKFLNTLEFVADELFAAGIKNDPKMNSDYIKSRILERRYNIQYGLDQANMQNGCNTPETDVAKAHYEEFSRYHRKEIIKFIAQQTRN